MTNKEIKEFMENILHKTMTQVKVEDTENGKKLTLVIYDRGYSAEITHKQARDYDEVRQAWAAISAEFYQEFSKDIHISDAMAKTNTEGKFPTVTDPNLSQLQNRYEGS